MGVCSDSFATRRVSLRLTDFFERTAAQHNSVEIPERFLAFPIEGSSPYTLQLPEGFQVSNLTFSGSGEKIDALRQRKVIRPLIISVDRLNDLH